jgi:SAM-dependent methyltransferase
MNNTSDIKKEVEKYYSDKIRKYGISAKGVDWNSVESQNIRFSELLKVIKTTSKFSILDFGCGYGALIDFMLPKFDEFSYTGYDISKEMLSNANGRHRQNININWLNELNEKLYDYSIASGIFNVRLKQDINCWEIYIEETLQQLNQISKKGFSFNMLTKYSDVAKMKDFLFYADPCYYFDYCKKKFSKNIALLHDYELYEFSIIVKK